MHMVIFVMPLNMPVLNTPAQVHTNVEAITLEYTHAYFIVIRNDFRTGFSVPIHPPTSRWVDDMCTVATLPVDTWSFPLGQGGCKPVEFLWRRHPLLDG